MSKITSQNTYEISSEGYRFENCLPSEVLGKEYEEFLRLDLSAVGLDKVEITAGLDVTEGITYPILWMHFNNFILECRFYSHWQDSAPEEQDLPDSKVIIRLMETYHGLKIRGIFDPWHGCDGCTLSFEDTISGETLAIDCFRVLVHSVSSKTNNN